VQLKLNDPTYTDRLAEFLISLGQTVIVAGPGQIEADDEVRPEMEIFLKVWRVLYPEAGVSILVENG
jgi:hypothetical protein